MTKIAYRSEHPDVRAHIDRHTQAFKEWRENVRITLEDLGFQAGRNVWMEDTRVVGILHPSGDPVPEGWRRDKRATEPVIVPARATKLGKQHARTLAALRQPDPRRGLPGGMPSQAMARDQIAFMHCGFRVLGEAAFVTWSSDLRDADADRIDSAIWEQIKLSEYFAVLEDSEAGR